jgi:hypothetical protein
MRKRLTTGRALFYTRDSGGEHETTPGEYVGWAQKAAVQYGIRFRGTADQIESMIRRGCPAEGDVFLDYCAKGNLLARPGLEALKSEVLSDPEVSHVLIPRRDRLARPDDPLDAIKLEGVFLKAGVSLVFMDKVLSPLPKGGRRDIGELIVGMIDYNSAGEFRRDLAQKMIYAQLALAKAGFSVGGRAPYGFRRWLAKSDGTPVRQLAEGEYVKMAGHHVLWLPGPEEELSTIRRVLVMLESMPATRVAAALTREGVPPPDFGRRRTDGGVSHTTSGVWHQTTITNIARNPLVLGIVAYGRRSMGDQLRFTPGGPRPLEESDYHPDGKPKVVANPASVRVAVPAVFEPLVDPERHRRLLDDLDRRGGNQRGKPRSRDPGKNPLGSRVFDLSCGWPMYRQPYAGSFRYLCGFYQQSHGARCQHNHVGGLPATRFVLNAIRQRVLAPPILAALEERIRRLAEARVTHDETAEALRAKKASLRELGRKLETVSTNMALAGSEGQFRALSEVFDRLDAERQALEADVRVVTERAQQKGEDPEKDVAAALSQLGHLEELAADPENVAAIGELFARLNARMYLRFRETAWGKRSVNRVSGGVVTFGATPPPVPLYEGPTSRRQLQGSIATGPKSAAIEGLAEACVSGQEKGSLGNVNRGERI